MRARLRGIDQRGLPASDAHSIVAGAAIDGAIVLWQERNLCLHAALSTDNGVHFAGSAFAAIAGPTRRTASRAARRTAARLIHQAFLLVKLLFTGSEHEIVTTFPTSKGFVDETQLETSL